MLPLAGFLTRAAASGAPGDLVTGVVKDVKGNPVPGDIVSDEAQKAYTVVDVNGAFSFAPTTPRITVTSLGYKTKTLTVKGSVAAVEIDDVNTNSILYGNTTINPKTGRVNVKNGASTKYAVTYRLAEKMVLEESTSDPIVVEPPAKNAPAYEEAFSWVKQSAAHDKTMEYAVQHPTEMIAGQTCWYDPSVEGEIWSNGVKGLYDPCPAGYKAPDYDYSGGAYASINSADTYSKDEVNGGIVMDGMYWTTAQRSDNTDNAQSFQASSTKQSYDRKSSAFSIRCQKLSAQ